MRPPDPPLRATLSRARIDARGYGRVRYLCGFDKHDGHSLPFVVFVGGARVALYCVPDPDDGATWRHVFSPSPSH